MIQQTSHPHPAHGDTRLPIAKAHDDPDKAHHQSGTAIVEESAELLEAKETYCFYGSLMYPRMIQHVLDLPELPVLKAAEVVGLRIKMLGPYPTLVDGEPGMVVRGMAFDVEGSEQKEKLAKYETECYKSRQVLISIDGEGGKVQGKAFVWNGNADDLDEGAFDIESWERRMSRILNR